MRLLSNRGARERTSAQPPRREGPPLPAAPWSAGAPPPWPRRSSRSAAAPAAFACRTRRACRCAGFGRGVRSQCARVAARRRACAAPCERQHEVHGALRRRLGPRVLRRRLLQQLSHESAEKADESELRRRRATRDDAASARCRLVAGSVTRRVRAPARAAGSRRARRAKRRPLRRNPATPEAARGRSGLAAPSTPRWAACRWRPPGPRPPRTRCGGGEAREAAKRA